MPGVPLDLEYPLFTDPLSTAFPTVLESLQTIETDLEAPVTAAELDINAALDIGGYPLTDVGRATFAAVPDTSGYPGGTIMYDGSEWYLNTSSGTVQVTLNGDLNAAAIGGIVGDYGGANPAAVTFVDASAVYRFTEDTGNWADLEAEDLILHGSGSAALTLTTTLTTNKTVTVADGSIPGSGTALLGVTTAGLLTASPTIDQAFTVNNADVVLAGTAEIQHPNKVLTLSFMNAAIEDPTATAWLDDNSPVLPIGIKTTDTSRMVLTIPLLPGDRIKTINVAHKGTNAGDDFVFDYYKIGTAGQAESITNAASAADITTLWAESTFNVTDTVIGSGEAHFVMVTPTQANSIYFGHVEITYDHP